MNYGMIFMNLRLFVHVDNFILLNPGLEKLLQYFPIKRLFLEIIYYYCKALH